MGLWLNIIELPSMWALSTQGGGDEVCENKQDYLKALCKYKHIRLYMHSYFAWFLWWCAWLCSITLPTWLVDICVFFQICKRPNLKRLKFYYVEVFCHPWCFSVGLNAKISHAKHHLSCHGHVSCGLPLITCELCQACFSHLLKAGEG